MIGIYKCTMHGGSGVVPLDNGTACCARVVGNGRGGERTGRMDVPLNTTEGIKELPKCRNKPIDTVRLPRYYSSRYWSCRSSIVCQFVCSFYFAFVKID